LSKNSTLNRSELTGRQVRLAEASREHKLHVQAAKDAQTLRDELLIEEADAGAPYELLAQLAGISATRVAQIIAEKG
jgi:hypothetical protein